MWEIGRGRDEEGDGEGGEKDLPCICPIINSLSNLSVPARRRSLPPRAERNLLLRPVNQSCQNGWVAARSVRQVHDSRCGSGGGVWEVDGSGNNGPYDDVEG